MKNGWIDNLKLFPLRRKIYLLLMAMMCAMGSGWAQAQAETPGAERAFEFFSPFREGYGFNSMEQIALVSVLVVAVIGLLYAFMLMKQVTAADDGTPKMQAIGAAIREGANAYLSAQFKKIGPLIIIITVLLAVTFTGSQEALPLGPRRRLPGRRDLQLPGGLRRHAPGHRWATCAWPPPPGTAIGEAMQLGYRTGTITGMLTDGLGLLGGTLIFLLYGEKAYEALLGFGFGGTLLALFMRVGGGIYTKAADVGADLVGKIEKDIPEDDPRNAATIADNVGDNVGDCAGMAADIFESYEVTIVAAMILGMATFGHKGVIFPLLVRGIGVLGSHHQHLHRQGRRTTTPPTRALKSVHRGFWIGSVISVVGFFILGLFYLRFDTAR